MTINRNDIIRGLDGDDWRVNAIGATFDGKTYVGLVSLTRGRKTKAGWYPVQMGDWLDLSVTKIERQ